MGNLVLGIDEVGRGAWAGPLVVGTVVFDQDIDIVGLDDSKKLTRGRREKLVREIKSKAVAIGVGWVDANTLDQIGMSASLRLATERAFSQIPLSIRDRIDRIIIDGTIKLLDDARVITLIKADSKIKSVSAASIIAKVARDNYMKQLNLAFDDYDFSAHVGYGTAKHLSEIQTVGIVDGIHRQSFAPIARLAGSPTKTHDKVSNTVGRQAEFAAADYLEKLGYVVVDQNWRTKLCEIDIVSTKDATLCFHEVKYRAKSSRGDGLAAITPTKLKQMKFAAKVYLTYRAKQYAGYEIKLSAISMSGKPPTVDTFIENVL